jgi:hypothetical protein
MKDKFFLNYRQTSKRNDPEEDSTSVTGSSNTLGTGKGRKHNYLHDHRGRDSLTEYIDNLEE